MEQSCRDYRDVWRGAKFRVMGGLLVISVSLISSETGSWIRVFQCVESHPHGNENEVDRGLSAHSKQESIRILHNF